MIQLTPVKISRDLSFIYRIMTDYEQSSLIVRQLQCNSFEDFESWFKNQLKQYYQRFYMIQENGNNLGFVYSYDYNALDRNAKMSLYVLPEYQGLGIGAIATILFLHKLFVEVNLKKVYSYVYEYNKKSYECNVQAGFIQEGCLKEDRYYNEKFWDMYIFSTTKEVFEDKYKIYIEKYL